MLSGDLHCNNYMHCLQEVNMWQDALRVCKDYIPNKLDALQEEYDQEMSKRSTK